MLCRQFDLRVRRRVKFTCRIVQPRPVACRNAMRYPTADSSCSWNRATASNGNASVHRICRDLPFIEGKGGQGGGDENALLYPLSTSLPVQSSVRTISLCIHEEARYFSRPPGNRYFRKIVVERGLRNQVTLGMWNVMHTCIIPAIYNSRWLLGMSRETHLFEDMCMVIIWYYHYNCTLMSGNR